MATHAQDRALQRYNKELTDKDLICIQKAIQSNQHTPLYCDPRSKSKKFCYVTFNHIPYKVLYTIRKKHCKLITIYPFDPDEYNAILEVQESLRTQKYIKYLQAKGYKVEKEDGN